jgi:hypothetical protein
MGNVIDSLVLSNINSISSVITFLLLVVIGFENRFFIPKLNYNYMLLVPMFSPSQIFSRFPGLFMSKITIGNLFFLN